jgi:hydroxyacylglutathione hydrolase
MPKPFQKTVAPGSLEPRALHCFRHPGIVQLIADCSAAADGPHVLLCHVEGPTLAERIRMCPLTEPEADQLATRLVSALCHVHEAGWLHNDVSPSNIILSETGAVLIDFSAATRRETARPHEVGTLHYMAPERFDQCAPSPASDFYSLGIVLYEALAGRLPFEAESRAEILTAHHRHLHRPLLELRPGLSPELLYLVQSLTARQPRDRMVLFQTLPTAILRTSPPPMIPLEDLHTDVLGKAQRGHKLDDAALAQQSGITVEQLAAAKRGESVEHLEPLASALGLHAGSLLAMARSEWRPEPVVLEGLMQFNTPFDDMTVNAYLVYDPVTKQAAAFDTGATAEPLAAAVRERGLTLTHLFITHTHPDHIADMDGLHALQADLQVFTNELEPAPSATRFAIADAPVWAIGALSVTARLTTGHSKGGTTFVISGLAKPVAIVGDALFASSMGGGAVSFADALATNRAQLFTLPDETVVCAGHGPMTTIGEEKLHNPFYPEYKNQA